MICPITNNYCRTNGCGEKLPAMRGAFCWVVTGTFHGSIIEAQTEGEARRIFHKHYNGESITHIKKRNVPAWAF